MSTKVYRLYQLGREGNSFNLEQRKEIRSSVKIDETLAEIYNDNAIDSGKLYVINEEETERLFGKPKPKVSTPVIPAVTESVTETPEQLKYNVRKDKMIAAGFVFNETDNVFERGKVIIKAEALLDMPPAKYGKLLKL